MKKVWMVWVGIMTSFLCASDNAELLRLCSPTPLSPTEKDFSGRKLDGFNGCGKVLNGAHFERCSLKDADFRGAFLVGVHFEGADLSGARFNGAHIDDLQFDEKTIVDKRTDFQGVSYSFNASEELKSFLEKWKRIAFSHSY